MGLFSPSLSARGDHESVERPIHVQLGQFAETADVFSVYDNLRNAARAVRCLGEFAPRRAVEVDTHLAERDAPTLQRRFGLYADRTHAGAVDDDTGHWGSSAGWCKELEGECIRSRERT